MINANPNILILSNITLNPIAEYLSKINKTQKATYGNFDNIWSDIIQSNNKIIFVHCDIFNITPDIRHKYNDKNYCKKLETFLKKQILKIKQKNSTTNQQIIFSTLDANIFSQGERYKYLIKLCQVFNNLVTENFSTINISNIIFNLGIKKCYRPENLFRFGSPYTLEFLKALAQQLSLNIDSLKLIKKKVLIVDCDNTLWGGVLGEDGSNNIEYSSTPYGICFREVQNLIVQLVKNGNILCLCSKNNYSDVELLLKKKLMPIKNSHITISKVNWLPKVQNIKEISKELNLGIDSFVFLDDSEFEVNAVKKYLPEIKIFKVPENIFLYPDFFRKKIMKLFNEHNLTYEDKKRVKFYEKEKQRIKYKIGFEDENNYIDSLKLKIKVFHNKKNKNFITRLSQMTQKTNQFNLTTKRYEEKQIKQFIFNKNYEVFSGDVSDRFGAHGKTILMILKKINEKNYEIDTLLMSCRVIGRKIEYVFFDKIYKDFISKNKISLIGRYIKTKKNIQVADLYLNYGFKLIKKNKLESVFKINNSSEKIKENIRKIKISYA